MRFFERFDSAERDYNSIMYSRKYSFANSTTMLTDFATVQTNISAAQRARAIAAAGPIEDLDGMLASCVLNLQEVKQKLNYILFGNMAAIVLATGAAGVAGQAGALTQSGDSNAANTTTLLTNIYNNLS